MRASLHMDYEPIYSAEDSMQRSGKWYNEWYLENFVRKRELKKNVEEIDNK